MEKKEYQTPIIEVMVIDFKHTVAASIGAGLFEEIWEDL